MSKIVLNDIASGYASTGALNASFNAIEVALENTLSRDGATPNHMNAGIDMNSNRIYNLGNAIGPYDALSFSQFLSYVDADVDLTGVIPITWEFSIIGTQQTYTIPLAATNAVDMFIVSVSGLIQSPSSYTINIAAQTITFLQPMFPGSPVIVRLFGRTPTASPDSLKIDGLRAATTFTIIGTETEFTTPFAVEVSSTDVFLNGIKLLATLDYSVASNRITLTSGANIGDVLEVVSHSVVLAVTGDVLASQTAAADSAVSAALSAQSAMDAIASASTAGAIAGATSGAIAAAAGTNWLNKITSYTATSGDGIFADTTAAAFTITLPALPSIGHQVYIVDVASKFNVNNLTIERNSEKIMGLAENMIVSTKDVSFRLTYSGTSNGWRIL